MQLCKFHILFSNANLCLKTINRHFQNGFSPTHKIECLDHLVKSLQVNAVYFDKYILVLNKPYGLKKEPKIGTTPPGFLKLNPAADSLHEYSLQDAIPGLCEIYNVPKLIVVKCPDRYMSGLTILATHEKAINKVDRCVRRSKPTFQFPKYQAVCVGVPSVREKQHVLGMIMEERKEYREIIDKFKEKRMVFLKTWSKNELKRSEVTLLRIQHRVLSVSKHDTASLIEVSSNWNKAHCVRTFLAAQLLTPVLGDHVYSARVKYVLDRPAVGELWHVGPHIQYLPSKLKEQLKIRRNNEELTVPEHIHLSQITLPGYYKDKKDLVLNCSISTIEAFQYALDALELTDNQNIDKNADSSSEDLQERLAT